MIFCSGFIAERWLVLKLGDLGCVSYPALNFFVSYSPFQQSCFFSRAYPGNTRVQSLRWDCASQCRVSGCESDPVMEEYWASCTSHFSTVPVFYQCSKIRTGFQTAQKFWVRAGCDVSTLHFFCALYRLTVRKEKMFSF